MKKILLATVGLIVSLSLCGQTNSTQSADADKMDQQAISQSSIDNTISLYVRQNDFNRIAVSASKPVPETVYVNVVVWHAPPGIYDDQHGQDVATLTVTLRPGALYGSEELYLGDVPAYIIDGVYSAAAFGAGGLGINYVITR